MVEVRGRPRPSLETTGDLHVVVPAGIDDPLRPSGGNHYDRRVIDALRAGGRTVHEHPTDDLGETLRGLDKLDQRRPVVVVDGLLACAAPDVIKAAAERLQVVVLLHMPFGQADPAAAPAERAALAAAAGVVTTSAWARAWVVQHHGLDPDRVVTASPGVDPADVSRPVAGGGRLLCLAAVTRAKGHDVLLGALTEIADLEWTLTCVGAVDLEPSYVDGLREVALRSGIGDRIRFAGPLTGDALAATLAQTDLLVSASRHEAYGMGVTEALAHGVPVVVSDVGGHHEAIGATGTAGGGGILVPPDDPDLLATALRAWLTDRAARRRLRTAARRRRATLPTWTDTARLVDDAVNRMTTPLVSPCTTP